MAKLSRLTFYTALILLVPLATLVPPARADTARFDLIGPKIDVRVTRAGKTLPIASVPNLAAGDKLWLRPDLPPSQSVRYLLIVAFLRGNTNPPPDAWFTRIETWQKNVREEGVEVTVPAEAEQALLFLAPVTGGDFSTLRSAVRGRPGIFVRAAQDLNAGGFEQARIEKYLDSIRAVPPGDAKALQDHSNLLARTLALRPNADCFKQPPDQQVTCLTQTGSQTLLDDGHGQTVVAAITSGPSSDLIAAASYTQLGGGGAYSAYVGAIVDLGRLLAGLHTAQYQYIPAIAFPQNESLNLRLNTPPSFHNPKSVIVIGLPAIQNSVSPPLRSAEPVRVTCLLQPHVAIPVEGAPLVFSTAFAHDLVLHLRDSTQPDLPLTADAFHGGLVLAPVAPRKPLSDPGEGKPAVASPGPDATPADAGTKQAIATLPLTGTVRGQWGFDPFEGPTVPIQQIPGTGWKLVSSEPLIASGREDHLLLSASGTACLQNITLAAPGQTPAEAVLKPGTTPATVDVTLPPPPAPPGPLTLAIRQYGSSAPITLTVRTYAEPAHLDALILHAGDRTALLTGRHLDQVRQLHIDSLVFTPSPGAAASGSSLHLALAHDTPTPRLNPGESLTAHITLADSRVLDLPVTITPSRPSITLRSRTTPRITAGEQPSAIKLLSPEALRADEPISIVLKSETPIPRSEQIEIAAADPANDLSVSADDDAPPTVKLGIPAGTLVLQDAHTLRATFEPLKTLGPSIFGPIRLRAIEPATDPGDWIPLAVLVRLPTIDSLTCAADAARPCSLTGSSLFLIRSVAAALTPDHVLTAPTTVPEDFADTTLAVPHPVAGTLFLSLRDDPSSLATLTMPIQPEPLSTRPPSPHASVSPLR